MAKAKPADKAPVAPAPTQIISDGDFRQIAEGIRKSIPWPSTAPRLFIQFLEALNAGTAVAAPSGPVTVEVPKELTDKIAALEKTVAELSAKIAELTKPVDTTADI